MCESARSCKEKVGNDGYLVAYCRKVHWTWPEMAFKGIPDLTDWHLEPLCIHARLVWRENGKRQIERLLVPEALCGVCSKFVWASSGDCPWPQPINLAKIAIDSWMHSWAQMSSKTWGHCLNHNVCKRFHWILNLQRLSIVPWLQCNRRERVGTDVFHAQSHWGKLCWPHLT